MGARKDYIPWTDYQRQFVRDNHMWMSVPEMSREIGRTVGSIYGYVKQLKEDPCSSVNWTLHRKAIGL